MLLELGTRLQDARPNLQLLFTSQTQTSARLIAERLPENARHQMAPLDTPATARRFVSHWQPDLVIIGEGEIWPNLLSEVTRSDARLTLINARMAEKSLRNWARWPRTARSVFGQFDVIMAADERTAAGLAPYSASDVHRPGNLKSAFLHQNATSWGLNESNPPSLAPDPASSAPQHTPAKKHCCSMLARKLNLRLPLSSPRATLNVVMRLKPSSGLAASQCRGVHGPNLQQ